MAAIERFGDTKQLSDPGSGHFSITPSDSTDFTNVTRGIYVGVGGDIVIVAKEGGALTYKNALAGTIIPVRATRVNSTSTTATNLIGIF